MNKWNFNFYSKFFWGYFFQLSYLTHVNEIVTDIPIRGAQWFVEFWSARLSAEWWRLFLLCFRLLSQLSEKEREYQELLRNSVQRKQEQIDELRKDSVSEGNAAFYDLACYILQDTSTATITFPRVWVSVCLFYELNIEFGQMKGSYLFYIEVRNI